MKKGLTLLVLITFSALSWSQLPNSSIYLLKLTDINDSIWNINQISYLTAFNPSGYNNQVFLLDKNTLLASIGFSVTEQTDIYRFDLSKKTKENLSQSKSSEYSPRIDSYSNDFVSCIQVPYNDTSQQNLIQIPLVSQSDLSYRFYKFDKIGYYRPLSDGRDVCFLVGSPHLLAICHQKSNTKKIFASDIGRCFEVNEKDQIYFVHKINPSKWILKAYNIQTEISTIIADMPVGTEDFAINENNDFFCTSGSKILKLGKKGIWNTVADLSGYSIKGLSRLSVRNNLVALVNKPNE